MALRAMTEGEIPINLLFSNKEGLNSLPQSASPTAPSSHRPQAACKAQPRAARLLARR